MVADSLERLITLIRKEQVTLFIGAGFSLKAGAPNAKSLAEAFKNAITSDVRDGLQGEQLEYLSGELVEQNNGSREEMERILQEQLNFEIKDMSDHQMLANIPHFRKIFTTNYDSLLEKSLSQRNVKVIVQDSDCSQEGKYNAPELYKIHGDLQHKDKIVITRKDYDDFIAGKRDEFLYGAMVQAFVTNNILFIGYSLSDNNIKQLIEHINSKLQGARRDVFLLSPNLAESKQKYLQRNGIEYINSTAEEFLSKLSDSLKANITRDFRDGIVSTETFAEFCNNFGLLPKIQLNKDKRKLQGVDYDINTAKECIDLTVFSKSNVPDLRSLDFAKDGVVLDGNILPSVTIDASNIYEFRHKVNGITIVDKNDLENVTLSPSIISEGSFTLKVPDISFLEQLSYVSYRLNDSVMEIAIETTLFVLYFSLDMNRVKDKVKHNCNQIGGLGFKVTFKNEYKSFEEANKWIDFLIAVTGGSEFIMDNFLGVGKIPPNSYCIAKFKEYKEFYENVRKIELYRGEIFAVHQAFTQENLEASRVILQLLEGARKRKLINKNGKISVSLSIPNKKALELCSNVDKQPVRQVSTTENEIVFNEVNFGKITHIREFPKMKFDGIKIEGNERIALFSPLTDYVWELYEVEKS